MSEPPGRVLADHRRRGNVFKTPFNQLLQPLTEISWVRAILPEVLWIALVQRHLGLPTGPETVSKLAGAARGCASSPDALFFSAASSYARFSPDDWRRIRAELSEQQCLGELRSSVAPLVASYPECPLGNLYTEAPIAPLAALKDEVSAMLDRSSRDATLVQATVVILAFQSGQLTVDRSTGIAQLRHIEDYPNTEVSRRAAASARAGLNHFFGTESGIAAREAWRSYFWNRGLALEPCEFAE